MVMSKCIVCDKRPATQPHYYCANCAAKIEAESKQRKPAQPDKFLTYRGNVVGLYPNGGGMRKAKLLRRSPTGLPKGKTLDLNGYLEGFTREQIKRFKACVLHLSDPMIGVEIVKVKE